MGRVGGGGLGEMKQRLWQRRAWGGGGGGGGVEGEIKQRL